MATIAKKLQIGTAAFAVAAVGFITPVVALADTDSDSDSSVGSSASKTPKREKRGGTATTPSATSPSADATASATGDNPLIQNSLIWIGRPNPNPPPVTVEIETFEPLGELPEFTQGMFGWMEDFEFEACVLGLGSVTKGQSVVGPYGTSTTGFSSGGC